MILIKIVFSSTLKVLWPHQEEQWRGKREPQEWPKKSESVRAFFLTLFHQVLVFNNTCCFAMATHAVSYILTLEMPMPQKIANASRKFSSFDVKGRSWSLLTSWNTPSTRPGEEEYFIGIAKTDLCLNEPPPSTLMSNLKKYKLWWNLNSMYIFRNKTHM